MAVSDVHAPPTIYPWSQLDPLARSGMWEGTASVTGDGTGGNAVLSIGFDAAGIVPMARTWVFTLEGVTYEGPAAALGTLALETGRTVRGAEQIYKRATLTDANGLMVVQHSQPEPWFGMYLFNTLSTASWEIKHTTPNVNAAAYVLKAWGFLYDRKFVYGPPSKA